MFGLGEEVVSFQARCGCRVTMRRGLDPRIDDLVPLNEVNNSGSPFSSLPDPLVWRWREMGPCIVYRPLRYIEP